MMKLLTILALAVVAAPLQADGDDPVKWTFAAKKLDGATHEVRLAGTLEGGWHLYSQSTPEGGPVPTSIVFENNPALKLNGETKEAGKLEKHFDPQFGVQVKQFSDQVTFVQAVTLQPGVKTALKGSITYMVCNDEQCLPPKEVKFSIPVG
jgi:thiol:disulfide interchange protein DsbD